MFELPPDIVRVPALPALVLVAAGLVVAFLGRTLWKVTAFIVGAAAGASAGYVLSSFLAPGSGACSLSAIVLGALIGGALALALVRAFLALAVGAILAGLVATLTTDQLATLVAFLIGFALAWVFMDSLMAGITAVAGGALVGIGVWPWATGAGGELAGAAAAVAAALLVSAGGIYYQLRSHGSLSRPGSEGD